MKIELFWVFLAVIAACLSWEEQHDKDRCFEAVKAHVELKDCK
jgi:uncharacterized membrane protein